MEKGNKIIYPCMLSIVPFRTPSIVFSTHSFNNSEISILSESGFVILFVSSHLALPFNMPYFVVVESELYH